MHLIIPLFYFAFKKESGHNSLTVFLIPNLVIACSLKTSELEYFKLLTTQENYVGQYLEVKKNNQNEHICP